MEFTSTIFWRALFWANCFYSTNVSFICLLTDRYLCSSDNSELSAKTIDKVK